VSLEQAESLPQQAPTSLQHLITLQRPAGTRLLPKPLGPGDGSHMGTSRAVSGAGCWEIQAARSCQHWRCWQRVEPGGAGPHQGSGPL